MGTDRGISPPGRDMEGMAVLRPALPGKNLIEADLRRRFHVSVIALRHGGEPQVNPDPNYRFAPGDDIFLIGTEGALAEFERSL